MNTRNLHSIWEARRDWLFDVVLPFWVRAGVDPAGGFHDQLDARGVALNVPKRLRVQARQIVVYAQAGTMGWPGPWRDMVEHGLEFIRTHALPNGLLPSFYDNGRAAGLTVYDQAFVLLALAHACEALDRSSLEHDAWNLLQRLHTSFGRADGGFDEYSAGSVPLQANTNMHMFEAFLAWGRASSNPVWREASARISHLARHTFIDPKTKRLREFFDDAGVPDGGQRTDVEPGHEFEWGSLFFIEGGHDETAKFLIRDASKVGVDRKRNVAVNSLKIDGSIGDGEARLWVQAERLRAVGMLAARTKDNDDWQNEVIATDAVMSRYFQAGIPGLWHDIIHTDGTLGGIAQASSLYHIFGAYLALRVF